MSLPLLYPETLGNECSQFKSPSLLLHFSFIYHRLQHNFFCICICKPLSIEDFEHNQSRSWCFFKPWTLAYYVSNSTASFVTTINSPISVGHRLERCIVVEFYWEASSHGVPSPKSQVTWCRSMQSQLLRAWNFGLTTSHRVPSPKSQGWHGYLFDNTFIEVRLGTYKKLGPTLNTSPKKLDFFCIKQYIWTWLQYWWNIFLMMSWGSKVGTLRPCWDLHYEDSGMDTAILRMEWHWQLVDVTLWDFRKSSLGPLQIVYVTPSTINGVT